MLLIYRAPNTQIIDYNLNQEIGENIRIVSYTVFRHQESMYRMAPASLSQFKFISLQVDFLKMLLICPFFRSRLSLCILFVLVAHEESLYTGCWLILVNDVVDDTLHRAGSLLQVSSTRSSSSSV